MNSLLYWTNNPSEKKYSLFILTGQQIYFICTICCGNLVHFSPTWNHLLNQWHLRWRECHLLTCLVITPDGHYITPDGQAKFIIIGSSYDDMMVMVIIACTILDSRVQVFDWEIIFICAMQALKKGQTLDSFRSISY